MVIILDIVHRGIYAHSQGLFQHTILRKIYAYPLKGLL